VKPQSRSHASVPVDHPPVKEREGLWERKKYKVTGPNRVRPKLLRVTHVYAQQGPENPVGLQDEKNKIKRKSGMQRRGMAITSGKETLEEPRRKECQWGKSQPKTSRRERLMPSKDYSWRKDLLPGKAVKSTEQIY